MPASTVDDEEVAAVKLYDKMGYTVVKEASFFSKLFKGVKLNYLKKTIGLG